MKTKQQELEELAAAIAENEDLDPILALAKAREMLADLKRAAYEWDHRATLAGNPDAIRVERN